jgi:hypothetical protein
MEYLFELEDLQIVGTMPMDSWVLPVDFVVKAAD